MPRPETARVYASELPEGEVERWRQALGKGQPVTWQGRRWYVLDEEEQNAPETGTKIYLFTLEETV
jgi:hypothetical protein